MMAALSIGLWILATIGITRSVQQLNLPLRGQRVVVKAAPEASRSKPGTNMSLRKAKRQLFTKTINRKIAWNAYCRYRVRVAKNSFLKFQINVCSGAYDRSLAGNDINATETFAVRFQELFDMRAAIKKEINKARKSFNPKKALRKYKLPG